jgi:chemotaxis response regulator CheB
MSFLSRRPRLHITKMRWAALQIVLPDTSLPEGWDVPERLVVLGGSAAGAGAVTEVVRALPAGLAAAIAVAVHFPAT